ncbi:MAG TPA: thiamine pyrophosphate-requiring protein, partial [Hyphomicrobiales bacterium]|nr:thiamine pyrophosphate-requiring protein [Hyphomicrobiales bacterium]
ANCAIGAINAATEQIPVMLFSGRTPTTEKGRFGCRTVPIGWGQEMRDQAALIREACKWDYELRFPEQAVEMVDRAYAIANSTPRGPVYISLPREVLCEPCPCEGLSGPPIMTPARAAPDRTALAEAAEILASAKKPVIFAQRGAGSADGFEALARLAGEWGIPVVQYWAIQLAMATDHEMAAGIDPEPWISEADAILAIDALAPWSPQIHKPDAKCKIIHLGGDPLYARFPVRNFRADIALVGDTGEVIQALESAMSGHREKFESRIAPRRKKVRERTAAIREQALEKAKAGSAAPMTKDWVSLCLSDAIAGYRATVLSELGCPLPPFTLRDHQSWYQEPHSGGLGWSFPAAMGMQLADPDRLVVATMGDGSYMFANPVACHQIAEALGLPILIVVVNNREWGAVRQSVLGIYPEGHAARSNVMPLTSLSPTPDFVQVAKASRAWAQRVENGEDLHGTLRAAIEHVTSKKTHALVEVTVRP